MREFVELERVELLFSGHRVQFIDHINGVVYIRVEHPEGAVLHLETMHDIDRSRLRLCGGDKVLALDPEGVVFFSQDHPASPGERVEYPDGDESFFPETAHPPREAEPERVTFFPKDGCPVELLEPEQRCLPQESEQKTGLTLQDIRQSIGAARPRSHRTSGRAGRRRVSPHGRVTRRGAPTARGGPGSRSSADEEDDSEEDPGQDHAHAKEGSVYPSHASACGTHLAEGRAEGERSESRRSP